MTSKRELEPSRPEIAPAPATLDIDAIANNAVDDVASGNEEAQAVGDPHAQINPAAPDEIGELLEPPPKDDVASGNEEAQAVGDPHAQINPAAPDEIGELLEPPPKVARMSVPCATREKQIDMNELKRCIWKLLTENTPAGEEEDVQPTTFQSIYSRLPPRLSSSMRESLSPSIAVLAVLHLATDKGLIMRNGKDLTDFDIVGISK